MDILNSILLILFYLITPLGVLYLCNRFSYFNKVGAIIVVYFIGIVISSGGIIEKAEINSVIQDILSTVAIVLSIPLILMSNNIREWSCRKALKIIIIGITSIITISIVGAILFYSFIDKGTPLHDEFYKISGVLVGVYTGGTPNLAVLKVMLDLPNELYILIHSYDMIVSFSYILFLLVIGIKLFRRLLNGKKSLQIAQQNCEEEDLESARSGCYDDRTIFQNLTKNSSIKSLSGLLGLALLIGAISIGISSLFPDNIRVVIVMLSVTSLGIAASLTKKISKAKVSYDLGIYLVLIFSLVISTMVDIKTLFTDGNLILLGYIVFVVFGSLIIQTILAKIFKIDADTSVIASVTLINSPPFVPLVAAAMRNKNVVMTGLIVGVIGYAVGNYLGYIIAKALQLILPSIN